MTPSGTKEVMRRRPAEEAAEAEPHRDQCPRCLSRDTKFCYYNNYNTAQPRHFCKSCRRYWTLGGTLRNVPIGGSSRNRLRRSSPSSTFSAPRPVISPPPIAATAQAPVGGFSRLLSPAGFLAVGEPLLGLGFGLGAEMEFGMVPGLLWPPALLNEEARNTWRFGGRSGEECGVGGGGGGDAPAGGGWRELDVILPGGGGAANYPLK